MLSDNEYSATVICTIHAETIHRYNNLLSIHDCQDGGHSHSVIGWSEKEQIPPFNFFENLASNPKKFQVVKVKQ